MDSLNSDSNMNCIQVEVPATLDQGILKLQIDSEIVLNLSATEAQQMANEFVHRKLSTQLHAATPTLVLNGQVTWRVPLHLTFPTLGDVGCVGYLTADPQTKTLDTAPKTLDQISHNANKLAQRLLHSAKA